MADSTRHSMRRAAAAAPAPVQVLIGGRWLTAKAHAVRDGRLGSQVLIDCHGHLVWVHTARVRRGSTPSGQPDDLSDQPGVQLMTGAGPGAGTGRVAAPSGQPIRKKPDLASGTGDSEQPQKR